jgi:glutamate--cysteine ligase
MITKKKQIIEYFKSGIKEKKDFKIGIEHEKFLFNNIDNKRVNYFEFFNKILFRIIIDI